MKIGIPEILKYLRKENNLTQKQLAKETGLSLSAIVSYENGLREPNSKAMAVLESYFDVTGEYLRGELDRENFYANRKNIEEGLNELTVLMETFKAVFLDADQEKQIIATRLLENTLQSITKAILTDDSTSTFSIDLFYDLMVYFSELNHDGQNELIKRASELTQLKMYSSKKYE